MESSGLALRSTTAGANLDAARGAVNGVSFKPAQGSGGTAGSSQSLANTFDTFLALLTTQLQNQDPLDPLNSDQFTQQLVQFAGVEQSINTNKKLDQLVQLQTGNQINGALDYVGRTVEVVSDQLMLEGGASTITYGLDGNAANTVISIVNDTGRTVRTFTGETATGRHELVWDGRDSNGEQLPDGVYSFSVTAVDKDNATVDAVTATVGKVTGVEVANDAITLNIGDLGVPFESIFAVREGEPQT